MKNIIRTIMLVIAVCMVLSQLDAAVCTKASTGNKVQNANGSAFLRYDIASNSGNCTVAKDSGSDLIDGMYLDGPDKIFAFQEPLILHINKKAWESDDRKDTLDPWLGSEEGIKYEWFTDNSSVASFQKTVKYELDGCTPIHYNLRGEKHIFSVKAGSTRIHCRITDKEGHECTISKQVHIMGGKPIKSLKIGKWKIRNARLYSEWAPLYTNVKNKKVKIKCVPEKDWRVKRIIYVYQDRKGEHERDITKSKIWAVNKDDGLWIKIELVDKVTGQEFVFVVNDSTYTVVKLPIKYKAGSGVVAYCIQYGLLNNYTKAIKYKARASSNDKNYYSSRKDLVRKMIKQYGMNPEAITIKKKKICIKIRKHSYESVFWAYAKNKKELKKKSQIKYWERRK